MNRRPWAMVRPVIERLIRDGKCRQCCRPRGEGGSPTMCRPCLVKAGACNARRRALRVAAGLCVVCSCPRSDGTATMCRQCSDKINAASLYRDRARYRRRRAAGMCTSCPKPRGEDGTARQCRRCADRANTLKRERRSGARMPLEGAGSGTGRSH